MSTSALGHKRTSTVSGLTVAHGPAANIAVEQPMSQLWFGRALSARVHTDYLLSTVCLPAHGVVASIIQESLVDLIDGVNHLAEDSLCGRVTTCDGIRMIPGPLRAKRPPKAKRTEHVYQHAESYFRMMNEQTCCRLPGCGLLTR